MSKAYQTFTYNLPSQTYVAGGNANQTLRDLPKTQFGRYCHLHSFVYAVTFTPTYSSAPDLYGQNNVLLAADFWDGSFMRFQGGGNHLRAKELLHTGRIRNPDADLDPASTQSRYYRRVLHAGPPQYIGSPSDWLIPTGLLENGELRFRFGALSDVQGAGTVSAATATVRVLARLALLDEIRLPPAYQWGYQSLSATDVNVPGEALYDTLALLNSSSFDAITAGDFQNIRIDMGKGDFVPTIKCADLTAAFVDDFAGGEVGSVQGEPEASNDDDVKVVNRSSPAAVTAQLANIQPVLWAPPGCQISKLQKADSLLRLRWDGSQTTGVLLYGRILPQVPNVVATLIAKATARLGVTPTAFKIKTYSKEDYTGPYGDYMPWKATMGSN